MQGGGFFLFAVALVLSRHAEGQTSANVNEGCQQDGGSLVLRALSGTISSPGYPAMYPANSACTYLITVDEGKRIIIVFNALDIEEQNGCVYDYLQVRDGGETTATSVAKVCGDTLPGPITSTGNSVLINFRSDTSVGGEGFDLEWSVECLPDLFSCDYAATCIDQSRKCDLVQDCNDWADEGEECLAQGLGAYAAFSAGCQGDVQNITESGNLSTPNYPSFYIAGMDCSWSLAAAPESDGRYPVLMASFTGDFGVACSSGSIQITTTDSNGQVGSTTKCGERGGPVAIGAEEGQTMTLTFSPSSQPIGHGYMVEWSLCPPDSLACPEIGECFPPESGVTTCPAPTTQAMATGAGVSSGSGVTGGATLGRSSTLRPNSVTTAASDNSTLIEGPANTVCYSCEGTDRECMTGNGIGGTAMECQEDEACWVERIGDGQNVSYRRSCQPSCTAYWAYEICMTADGQDKVCKLCCKEDRCNTHVLTGHNDPRAPALGGNSGAEGILASLGLVSVLALAVCADILSLIA
ncbi:procollagen C-endopeptidase enhancer 1-like [Branchiostoma floridae x Branchiostoma belcheri]